MTAIDRVDEQGELAVDRPPPLPAGTSTQGIQLPRDGSGPLLHRRYRGRLHGSEWSAEALMAHIRPDPGRVAPWGLARFQKTHGERRRMAVGDEFVVRMPGPWDGPVRIIEVTPESFRLATLDGHLEAGQIEWRAVTDDGVLVFEVQSWARAGDRLSALLHDHLRMAKEVQLHMWTSVVERVSRLVGGELRDGIEIITRRVGPDDLEGLATGG